MNEIEKLTTFSNALIKLKAYFLDLMVQDFIFPKQTYHLIS